MRDLRRLVSLAIAVVGCGRVGFDASSPDGRDPDAATACARPFCDGFEDPGMGGWAGILTNGGATAERAPGFGHRGASLHVVAPPGSNLAAWYADVFPTPPPPELWVRAYVYAPASVSLNVEPLEIADPTREDQVVFSLYDTGTDLHAHGLAGDFNVTSSTVVPRDRWVCFELHVEVAASATVSLYLEGALLLSEPMLDTRPPSGSLSRIHVGVLAKPNGGTQELYIDEVAADTTRIGCT